MRVQPFSFTRHTMRMASLIFLLALTACGSPNDPGEGGVTKREADELNAIAAELDKGRLDPPSVSNTPVPEVPAPPPDPELDKKDGE